MKTEKQIKERISFLESRKKDGVPVEGTLGTLRWALLASIDDVREELENAVSNPGELSFGYIRDILWVLED